MKSKNFLLNFILCLSLLLLSSCLTKALWSDPFYEERIGFFLVGSDGRYAVFVGDRFHYVFTDTSRILKEVLSLKQREFMSIDNEKSQLELDSDNNITGTFVAKGPFSIIPEEDKYLLQSLGFKPDLNDEITVSVKVSGRRYAAKYLGPGVTAFNRFHMIRIYYHDYALMKGVGKAAVTPITMTLDAIMLIGKVMVYPLGGGDVTSDSN